MEIWRSLQAQWLLFLALVCVPPSALCGRRSRWEERTGAGRWDVSKDAAIERLTRVFELEKVPVHRHSRSPPEYMRELYDSLADGDGVSKSRGPYGADVVRGLPDRASHHKMQFFFNVSYVRPLEKVLEAEFHLFKLRPKLAGSIEVPRQLHVIELKLYQVLNPNNPLSATGSKLLEHRRVSAHTHGWVVFKVKDTVQEWVNHQQNNHGFLITATTRKGNPVNGTYVRFAQRAEHHDSKQPVLVVFTENDRSYRRLQQQAMDPEAGEQADESYWDMDPPDTPSSDVQTYIKLLNERYREEYASRTNDLSADEEDFSPGIWQKDAGTNRKDKPRRRTKRSKRTMDYYHYPRKRKQSCSKHELFVDFDEIGWSGWIISPKGYNAYHCKGECPFPLGQNQRPTNHATVQSIVNALHIGKDVSTPCCVPNKLYSISLLYFDDDENVILKQYDDMVAASCGCH